MMEITARIDDAFKRSEPNDAIQAVKEVVVSEIRSLDHDLELEFTPYFNHSFYPDVVAKWHESGVQRERPIFLRMVTSDSPMESDLKIHDETRGLFVGLLDHRSSGDWSAEQQEEALRNAAHVQVDRPSTGRSLVAEAAALGALERAVSDGPEPMAATSAVVRFGQGRLDGADGELLGGVIAAGFGAALAARDVDHVRTVLDKLGPLVGDEETQRVATQLQLLWLASGGNLNEVFGRDRLAVETLNPGQVRQVLLHLFDAAEQPSADFMRRFSTVIDPDGLGRLFRSYSGGHLDAFVRANLDLWRVTRTHVLVPKLEAGAGLTGDEDEASVGGPEVIGLKEESLVMARKTSGEEVDLSSDAETDNDADEAQAGPRWVIDQELLKYVADSVTLTVTKNGRKLPRDSGRDLLRREDFIARLAADRTVALDLVSDDAEVEIRRRSMNSGEELFKPASLDGLGDLAKFVRRARVQSTELTPAGSAETPSATLNFGSGVVAVDESASLRRMVQIAARYFGLDVKVEVLQS
jgi:hypothetical protein